VEAVWLWWSTGKDSAWALDTLRRSAGYEVERIISTVTPAFDRVAIHGVRMDILRAQGRALGIPIEYVELPYPCSNQDYEEAVAPVIREAASAGVRYMAFGDLFLEDVRAYRERLLGGSSVEALFPLWGSDTKRLAVEMIGSGMEAYVTCLDPTKIGRDLAGARYDQDFLESLPDSIDPCGENGEFHTCVVAGPMFEARIDVSVGQIVERSGFVYSDLELV